MTSRIVITVSGRLFPFILLFGIYIVLFGHLSPGGGFQGGIILAMGILLIILTYGWSNLQKFIPYLSSIETFGVTLFVIVGILGIVNGKQFLTNLGTVPLLNIIIGLKVLAGLVLMYLLLIKWELIND